VLIPLLFGIALGALTIIFALQNTAVITVSFLNWQFEGSLAFILILTASMGALIALLFILPESIRNHFRYSRLKKENAKLEEDLKKQKELTAFAKTTSLPPESMPKSDERLP
jgi:lipopolysaccharide assembly protein A